MLIASFDQANIIQLKIWEIKEMLSSKSILFGRQHFQLQWIQSWFINLLIFVGPNEAISKRKIENWSINDKVIAILNLDYEIA